MLDQSVARAKGEKRMRREEDNAKFNLKQGRTSELVSELMRRLLLHYPERILGYYFRTTAGRRTAEL